jgi:hypothetical protein
MLEEETRPGYYKDKYGNWQKDRRRTPDRRKKHIPISHHDRRRMGRRKADREILERDTREMIEEALTDFAAEHEHKPNKESSGEV